MLIIIEGT